MEINISSFFASEDPRALSASVAEMGESAGRLTWTHAVAQSDPLRYLTTDEAREAFREFVGDSGGWDEEEIRAWPDRELEALFLQWVAGDLREMFGDYGRSEVDYSALTDADWKAAEMRAEKGQASGNIYRGDDGQVYFYAGV